MKGRWNGGSFTPSMEESPRPHRSSSSAFSPQSSLSPRASPPVSPTSPRIFPQLPSLLPSLYLPLSSPPSSSLFIVPSLSSNVHPLSLRPRSSPSLRSLSLFALTAALSASRRNSLSRKKREKGTKNRCATPIGRARPG